MFRDWLSNCQRLKEDSASGRSMQRSSICLARISRSVVTSLRAGRPVGHHLITASGKRFFSLPKRPDRLWVPPSLLGNGYRGLFPRDWSSWWQEADHSPPYCADDRNEWSYARTSAYTFMACLGTHLPSPCTLMCCDTDLTTSKYKLIVDNKQSQSLTERF